MRGVRVFLYSRFETPVPLFKKVKSYARERSLFFFKFLLERAANAHAEKSCEFRTYSADGGKRRRRPRTLSASVNDILYAYSLRRRRSAGASSGFPLLPRKTKIPARNCHFASTRIARSAAILIAISSPRGGEGGRGSRVPLASRNNYALRSPRRIKPRDRWRLLRRRRARNLGTPYPIDFFERRARTRRPARARRGKSRILVDGDFRARDRSNENAAVT